MQPLGLVRDREVVQPDALRVALGDDGAKLVDVAEVIVRAALLS